VRDHERERGGGLAKSCGLKKSQVTYFCTFCHASTTGRPCLSTMPRVFSKEKREKKSGYTSLLSHSFLFLLKKILKNLYPRVLFFSFESFLLGGKDDLILKCRVNFLPFQPS